MFDSFERHVSILTNSEQLDTEFHLYEVGYEKCRPTKPYEYIPIDYWVLHYCVAGEGYFSTPIVPKQKITPGDVFLIPANSRNMYYPNPENPWTYRWVGFSGKAVEAYMKKIGFDLETCILKGTIDVKLSTLFESIYSEFKKGNLFAALSHSFSLFNDLMQKNHEETPTSISEQLFKEILAYIDENYTYNLSITEIAKHHNIDRTYLFKLFMRYMEIGPSIYIQTLKLEKACSLLRKSSLNITDISYQTGFSSPSYFSKFFFSKMNMTPLNYRNRFILMDSNKKPGN